MEPTILFINTGIGRNLGDRAMLLNLIENIKNISNGNIIVPRQLPHQFQTEFETLTYTPYHECLDRFRRRLSDRGPMSLILKSCYFIHAFFMGILCIAHRWIPLQSNSRTDELQLINHLKSTSVVWLSGGGYITDKGKFECRCCLLTAIFALCMGKKVILTGQGIGPINSGLTKTLLRVVTKRSTYVSVRDNVRSQEYLANLTKGKVDIHMTGDDATSLRWNTPKDNFNNLENTENAKIAIHFRISPFTENSEKLKRKLSEFTNTVIDKGWKPVFFIFTSQKQWEHDLLKDLLHNVAPSAYEIYSSDDPREVKSKISECQIAIGVAYHFIVFCLCTGIPVIALYGGEYYRYKISGILKQFSQEKWMIEFSEFNPELTIRNMVSDLTDPNSISKKLIYDANNISKYHQKTLEKIVNSIPQ